MAQPTILRHAQAYCVEKLPRVHDCEHQGFGEDHVCAKPAVSILIFDAAGLAVVQEVTDLMREHDGAAEVPEKTPAGTAQVVV